MPTNSTPSEGARDGAGGGLARWEEGPLGFVYTLLKDKDAVGNLIRLLKIPLVQVTLIAVAVVIFACCGFGIADVLHHSPRTKLIAAATTGCAPAAYIIARRLLRRRSLRGRKTRPAAPTPVPAARRVIDVAQEALSTSETAPLPDEAP